MDLKTGGTGDASNKGFSSAEKIRFCSLTYEIIEELKLRRELASENEKKIEKLINDRFTLGWKLDQKSVKLSNLNERHEAELRETRRQMEEKMRDCQIEASQQQVYRNMVEKERDALKDEIRRLQLANYSLEKKVRESEHNEKIQASEREEHIEQVSRFESLYSQLDGMIKQLTLKQEQHDKDMKAIQNLSTSLQYQNSHQKCVLDMKEGDLAKLSQQLLDTQVKLKVDPNKVKEREVELEAKVRRLKTLVTKLEENNKSLEQEKDIWKEKYWASLKTLEEGHKLITVHLHSAARYREESVEVERLLAVTQAKLDDTESCLKHTKDELKNAIDKYRKEIEVLVEDAKILNSELANLKSSIVTKTKEKEELEKTLNNADESIKDLKQQLDCAHSMLNREKIHEESQTQLHMLQMSNVDVQACPQTHNQESQVEVDTCAGSSQTIDPALCSTEVQTDEPPCQTSDVQTDKSLTKSTQVQTDDKSNMKHVLTQTEHNSVHATLSCSSIDTALNGSNVSNEKHPARKKCEGFGRLDSIKGTNRLIMGTSNIHVNNTATDLEDLTSEDNNVNNCSSQKESSGNSVEHEALPLKTVECTTIDESIVEETLQSCSSMNASKSLCKTGISDTTNVISVLESPVKPFGLKIPKINFEVATVHVDPEEFGIELTQDEKATANDTAMNMEEDLPTATLSSLDCPNKDHGTHVSKGQQETEISEIDNSIAQHWKVSEVCKPKARKHKLSKEDVKDHFSFFDVSKEMYDITQLKDVHSKQPRLADDKACKKLVKKKRNFLSMFETDSETVSDSMLFQNRKDTKINEEIDSSSFVNVELVKHDDTVQLTVAKPDMPIKTSPKCTSVLSSSTLTAAPATTMPATTSSHSGTACVSKSSEEKETSNKSSNDFLQKYRDIVAKIKPVQHNSPLQTTAGVHRACGMVVDTPGSLKIPDQNTRVSPREKTPKGILRFGSRKEQKQRNVTWNEYVKAKDFINDDNTSGEA